jgi:hypothetical protein
VVAGGTGDHEAQRCRTPATAVDLGDRVRARLTGS